MKSTIKLFKAVPIELQKLTRDYPRRILEETIPKGFIFSKEVVDNYSQVELSNLITLVEKEVGLTGEQMNNSFHKSWQKVRDASIEQLVVEQIIHYITTYGFQRLGIYDKDSVYIPTEQLDVPEIELDKIKLTVIKGYTKEELKEKLLKLLNSGIALAEETIIDVTDLATFLEITNEEIENIKNKEVKIMLYDYLNIIPRIPIEFLRYIVYKSTGKTLLIKNKDLIEDIKGKNNLNINVLFTKYKRKYGLEELSKIFYRFKPIFLAFKTNIQLNSYINRIRKYANIFHKPMPEDYLNNITAKIKDGSILQEPIHKLTNELSKVNIFRKIRLAYALKFRTEDADSIMYKIRNGKSYSTDFNFENKIVAKHVFKLVIESIISDMKQNVDGKKIYIPENVKYTLPATEKQFTGNLPSGTYITIPKDMVFGIHWEDVGSHTIDLDLSIINATQGKIGWDGRYRDDERNVLFSGDLTAAPKPKGASELFYMKKQENESFIVMLNYYNYNEKIEVPFKMLVAEDQITRFTRNYMVNPNNVIGIAKTKINQRQKVLGLVTTEPNECRFYFTESYLGNSITSGNLETTEKSRNYLFNFYKNAITLNDLLETAGAVLVDNPDECDINLSMEDLEKDTILNLLIKKNE